MKFFFPKKVTEILARAKIPGSKLLNLNYLNWQGTSKSSIRSSISVTIASVASDNSTVTIRVRDSFATAVNYRATNRNGSLFKEDPQQTGVKHPYPISGPSVKELDPKSLSCV
ncbi:hypothetical protein AVEN_6618-1 [Araneus ventricosus]|uniref:Uncharacterized protein n=1 Tax=Araneus ventricosus TaxID=182803 RepID=A0A4Y2KZS2_ARAVE|nr:hypothetical protein AVEN_6618-1 [Araneus ventricosus]